jgi:hypothetical protein
MKSLGIITKILNQLALRKARAFLTENTGTKLPHGEIYGADIKYHF